MGQIQNIRHTIVANVSGTAEAGQVSSLLRGAPGFTVEQQIARFEEVRKVLKGKGQKASRKLAAEAVEVIKEREEQANAEPEVTLDDLVEAVYDAVDALSNALSKG